MIQLKRIIAYSIFVTLFISFNGLMANTIPKLINYQGVITEASGKTFNGQKTITFNIYDASGTNASIVWGPQTFKNVNIVNGRFNVILGEVDENEPARKIIDAFGGEKRFIGIKVDGKEIFPRQQVLNVPFAINAKNAISSKNAEIANTVQGDKLYVDPNSGNVGIGKTDPAVKLHVNGNIIASDPISLSHVATKSYVDNKWPDGEFCILKAGGVCPKGFKEGSIVFDTEDNDNQDSIIGNIGDSGSSAAMRSGIILKVCCKGE